MLMADQSPLARGPGFSLLREFVPVSIVLPFHLGQKLDEFGRLSDAVQISITLVSRIKLKTGEGGFS
jgi:hypothetical protein